MIINNNTIKLNRILKNRNKQTCLPFDIQDVTIYESWIIPLGLINFILNQFLDQFYFCAFVSSVTLLCRNDFIPFPLYRTQSGVYSSTKSWTSSKDFSWVRSISLIIKYLILSNSRFRNLYGEENFLSIFISMLLLLLLSRFSRVRLCTTP